MNFSRKNWYLTGAALLSAAALVFLLFLQFFGSQEVRVEKRGADEESVSVPVQASVGRQGAAATSITNLPPPPKIENAVPGPIPFSDLVLEFADTFTENPDFLQNAQRKLDAFRKQISPLFPPADRKLTEEEIFKILWPPDYIAKLRGLQEIVIKDGIVVVAGSFVGATLESTAAGFDVPGGMTLKNWYIPESERSSFSNNAEAYKGLEVIFGQAHQQGLVSDEDYRNLKLGLTEILPETIEKETEALRRWGKLGDVVPGSQRVTSSGSVEGVVQDLWRGLIYVFSIAQPANAAWFFAPDCYKDDNPFYPVPGFNGATFCCNCGIVIFHCGRSCCAAFIPECLQDSSLCTALSNCAPHIRLGCLNGQCQYWPNAIWDPTTGICGCG